MTLLLVFLGAIFTIYALWLAIAPFLGGSSAGARLEHLDEEIREIEVLAARREVLLTALRELEFERETDKLSPEDYDRFHKRYEREAVAIMRRLDEIHGGRNWRARVDAQLEERLGRKPRLAEDPTTVGVPAAAAEPESAALDVAAPPEENEEPWLSAEGSEIESASDDGATCPGCSTPLQASDRFCSQCGTPVEPHESMTENVTSSEASA